MAITLQLNDQEVKLKSVKEFYMYLKKYEELGLAINKFAFDDAKKDKTPLQYESFYQKEVTLEKVSDKKVLWGTLFFNGKTHFGYVDKDNNSTSIDLSVLVGTQFKTYRINSKRVIWIGDYPVYRVSTKDKLLPISTVYKHLRNNTTSSTKNSVAIKNIFKVT